MRAFRRCSRILILCLLCVSVFVPVFLLSYRLKHIKSDVSEDLVEDLSIIKHRTDAQILNAIQQEGEGLKEPPLVVYKEETHNSPVNLSYSEDTTSGEVRNAANNADLLESSATTHDTSESGRKRHQEELAVSGSREKSHKYKTQLNGVVRSRSGALEEKLKEMKDQVIRAKAYLNFRPSNSSSHIVKGLKLRVKEVERAMSQSSKNSRLPRSSVQKMKAMEATLLKASRIYPDCTAMIKKLRAMTHNAEEQVRSQRNQETFLRRLGGRTISKGLHCLSMRLTAEYFSLDSKAREFRHKNKLKNPYLYHFAVFSDNILACSVVVNSTVSNAREPERLVFHVVTDSLNLPAMSMWFLLNPPSKATVHVESTDSFHWLTTKYNMTLLQREGSIDPRYTSGLNHLRFYLPDVFPNLNKIVLLDHDVVVRKDLTRLWSISMRGRVNGAVQTCSEGEPSFRRMDMFVNFTDPLIADKYDATTCTWAFGMNIFDLREWRRRNLTEVYLKYLHLGNKRPILTEGSLPIGWLTFYKHTLALENQWQVLGLGHDSSVRQNNIDRAFVLHFDGIHKPWLDIGFERYKQYWRKHVKYDHPYLQQCNVHE
ncbi:Probable galacturonosyltransferase 6 [Striga hermonthica]|uniref:Hexosyltransferase n=1 Tax=Striga hermonthica TaxID=68872 RepID=A0A9N7RFA8_STRHE|nr:Probable galacturonosyltransferase 6 [Striga hermonthica]